MCGLIYAHNDSGFPVNKQIARQYQNQKHRGTEGFGVFDGEHNNLVHETKEKRILKYLKKHQSNTIMFHHRMPTSTKNVKEACHPFSTKKYFGDTEYIMVHNGGIWNDDSLYLDHKERDIRYQSVLPDGSFNDSEALLWDFALYMEGEQTELKVYGAIAFICVKLVKGEMTELYFNHNDQRPLKMKRSKKGLFISSEGKGTPLPEDVLYTYNYETHELDSTLLELRSWPKQVFSHNTWEDDINDFEYRATTNSGFSNRNYQSPHYDNPMPYGINPLVGPSAALRKRLEEPTRIPGGDWLGKDLEQKFNVQPTKKPIKVIEFVETASGEMIPQETVLGAPPVDPYTTAESIVMQYLITHKGVFETAYWALEGYYERYVDGMTSEEMTAYERALNLMAMNPEYEDENSTSSLWESLWNQPTLTA